MAKKSRLSMFGDNAEMYAYEPSLREKMAWAMAEMFGNTRYGKQDIAGKVQGAIDLVPGVGELFGADDTKRAFDAGNYGEAAYNAGTTALGVVPGGGDLLAGAMKAIVPVVSARNLKTLRKLPDSDEFQRAVANTPGAKIDPDGVVLPVTRNQRPEQSGTESVRGGVFYLPEGSKDAKYYSGTGMNYAYGGTDKIKGETLLSNPLFAKGATGGKAPAAAYDQLMGKGAYEKMRTEVLNHAVTPYYIKDPHLKAEQVSNFLEKYAPELVGQEYDIIAKSTKGNQLAYALQEAAVASAVRRAGHDGVLGYSTSRKTKEPFISEVFDVRERTYPTRSGGYSIWDDYE